MTPISDQTIRLIADYINLTKPQSFADQEAIDAYRDLIGAKQLQLIAAGLTGPQLALLHKAVRL